MFFKRTQNKFLKEAHEWPRIGIMDGELSDFLEITEHLAM